MKSTQKKQTIFNLKKKLEYLENLKSLELEKKIEFFTPQWYKLFQPNISFQEIKNFLNTKSISVKTRFIDYIEVSIQNQILNLILKKLEKNQSIDILFIKQIHKLLTISSYLEETEIYKIQGGSYRKKNLSDPIYSSSKSINKDLKEKLELLYKNENILENVVSFFYHFLKIFPFSQHNEKIILILTNYYLLEKSYVPVFFHQYPDINDDFFSSIPNEKFLSQLKNDFYQSLISSLNSYINFLDPKLQCIDFFLNKELSPLETIKFKNFSKYQKTVLKTSLRDLIYPILKKTILSIEELSYLFISFDKDFFLKYDNFLENLSEDFMNSSWIEKQSSILDRIQSIRVNYNFRSLKVDQKLESNITCTISILFDINQFSILLMSEGHNLSHFIAYYKQKVDESSIIKFSETCKKQFYQIIKKLAND